LPNWREQQWFKQLPRRLPGWLPNWREQQWFKQLPRRLPGYLDLRKK